MRPSCISLLAVAATLATPAFAQEQAQDKPATQAAAADTGAMAALKSAREQLRTAAQRLEQASGADNQEAVTQARTEIGQAVDAIRQAMTNLPPDQRANLQEGLRQAEQGMQISDPAENVQAAQRLDEAMGATFDQVVLLSSWSYNPLYADGWRSEDIWDAAVYGAGGEEIGDVENVLVGLDGKILSIIAEVGGLWDIGDTHVNVPWSEVTVGDNFDRLTIPVNEENAADYSLFKDWHLTAGEAKAETTDVDDDVAVGPHAWKLTDILDDYVMLRGGVPYGYVDDVVFDQTGKLQAIVVRPDISWGAPGYYAYPYRPWGPALNYHVLPYARADIEGLAPFDYGKLEGNEPAAG
jgi:sporulation protein YlmC with PRC-barrel domain